MHNDTTIRNDNLLITGQGGFVGQHLLQALFTREQWRGRFSVSPRPDFDLLAPESIERMIGEDVPAAVIHLAGQTSVPAAIANPTETLQINLIGTLNLLQALKKKGFAGTFLYVSSGDIYGGVAEQRLPISESEPPQPRNPYAVSKIATEVLCLQWSRVEPWRIIVGRPFNHIGAGQRSDFVISEIARQITRIKHNRQPPRLSLGDIDVSRDFLDVEDVISAYLALLAHGKNGEIYNVCSGKESVIRDLAEQMMALAGIKAEIERDSKRFRPADQLRVVGNSDKLRTATQWRPQIEIRESLQAILHDWETREKND
jgi:GDP-4-dehydro-6-deoxy-D-mannose reductase